LWYFTIEGIGSYCESEQVITRGSFDGNRRILVKNKNMFPTVISGTDSQGAIVHPDGESGQRHPLNKRLFAIIRKHGFDGQVAEAPDMFGSCVSVTVVDGAT